MSASHPLGEVSSSEDQKTPPALFTRIVGTPSVSTVAAIAADPVSFRREVIPAFTAAGCNAGACHGSPTGKNGFRLSLRGYDPDADFTTLTREFDGRRLNRLGGAPAADDGGRGGRGGRGGGGGLGGGINSLNVTRDGRTLFYMEGGSVY